MRVVMFIILGLLTFSANAQFPYSPFPFKGSDFKKMKELGYTKMSVYQVSGDEKKLVNEAEYGFGGWLAVLNEKEINDAGDTINKSSISYKYDGKGKLTQEDKTGEEESLTGYYYDSKGRLTQKIVATIDPPTYNYKYDANGRLKEVYVTQRWPGIDSEGNTSAALAFDKPAERYTFKSDTKGRVTEQLGYNIMFEPKTTTPQFKVKWTYNDKHQIIKVQRLGGAGVQTELRTYTYNKDGLISAATVTDDSGATVHYVYEYCKGCVQSWMK